MKTGFALRAPCAGRVISISAATGEQVALGACLVALSTGQHDGTPTD